LESTIPELNVARVVELLQTIIAVNGTLAEFSVFEVTYQHCTGAKRLLWRAMKSGVATNEPMKVNK
jgi:hypothetical protein